MEKYSKWKDKLNKRYDICIYGFMMWKQTNKHTNLHFITFPFRTLLVTYTLCIETHHRANILNKFRQSFCSRRSSIDCLLVERVPYFDQFSFDYELYKQTGTLSTLEEPKISFYSNGVVPLLCSNVPLLSGWWNDKKNYIFRSWVQFMTNQVH